MREDWTEAALGEVFETVTGNTPSKKDKDNYGSEIPFIKPPQINNNFLKTSAEFLSAKGKIKARILPINSVLVTCIGNLGRIGINKAEVAFNQQINAIKPISGVEPKYTFYQAQSVSFRNQLERLSTSTTVALVNKTSFNSVKIKIAPLPIQKAIVKKIEELFSSLDSGIADLKKAQDQLVIYRQAVLKKAFEGELTKEWREKQTNLPSADELLEQIKEERQKHYNQQLADWKKTVEIRERDSRKGKKPLKPKVFKELVTLSNEELTELAILPDSWKWEKNENYLFEVKDGTHDTPKYQEKGIPFITQKNIKNNNVSFSDVKYISQNDHNNFYKRSNVADGDIIIAMIGHGRGNCCIVNTDKIFSIKNVGLFKFFKSIQNNKYCLHYYQSTLGLNLALKKSKGGAQPFIGLTELRNWPIPICSLEEQHQIVQEIESRLSVCEKVETDIALAIERSRNLRQSILKKAFEGKLLSTEEIAACKQHPDYEPASVLLEKIRAEKKK